MFDPMQYKDYTAKITYNDGIFQGEVENIKIPLIFEGKDFKEMKKAFQESVDAYLENLSKKTKRVRKKKDKEN